MSDAPLYWDVIYIVIGLLSLVCMWIIFRKAGRPGWASVIPIYNTVVLFQIAGYSGWTVLLLLVPIVDVIISFTVYLKLAESFGRGTLFGLGLIFLPFIFLPIMAFSKNIQYEYSIPARPSSPATPGSTSSTREYYEKKVSTPAQPSAPVQTRPIPAAAQKISVTTPLPPLQPKIDDAAAQECFILAGEMEAKGEKDKAIEHYTKAIRLNSAHTVAYFKRGMLLLEMNFKPAAVADFRRVVEFADNPELAEIAKEHLVSLGQ